MDATASRAFPSQRIFDRLPAEIILLVFEALFFLGPQRDSPVPWTLSSVCSQWRALALRSSVIWNQDVFVIPERPSLGDAAGILLQLQRSGASPLTIRLTSRKRCVHSSHISQVFETSPRWKSLEVYLQKWPSQALRSPTLDLESLSYVQFRCNPNSALPTAPFAMARCIRMSVENVLRCAHSLKQLALDQFRALVINVDDNLTGLKTLLEYQSRGTAADTHMNILSSAPLLRFAAIECTSSSLRALTPIVTHTNLRTLSLFIPSQYEERPGESANQTMVQLLGRLRLPQLHTLIIQTQHTDCRRSLKPCALQALYRMLHVSANSLTKLVVAARHVCPWLGDAVSGQTRLEELHLHVSHLLGSNLATGLSQSPLLARLSMSRYGSWKPNSEELSMIGAMLHEQTTRQVSIGLDDFYLRIWEAYVSLNVDVWAAPEPSIRCVSCREVYYRRFTGPERESLSLQLDISERICH